MTERLTIGDVRQAGYCVSGARRRCRELNLDFKMLVREGLPFDVLEPLEDPAVRRSLAVARKRIAEEN
ncbi:hypothetical protein [Shimia sp.]|uniref:hypothetical protein n=1 Tax=Shimia sp. TaxID=1954381 RepID=UPI00329A1B21